jgi:hypothetical protein
MTIVSDFSGVAPILCAKRASMNNREAVLDAIANLVGKARPDEVDMIAIRLSTKYPQSGLTIDEICQKIAEAIAGKSGPKGPAS